ncbi:MAG: HNH endonuclease [Magnetococcales bacterium]|nr:HNH endonuclease [Magnetococcales bacterium]
MAAVVADHITPIKSGGDRYSQDNLQSLCLSCHSRKTAVESGFANRKEENAKFTRPRPSAIADGDQRIEGDGKETSDPER